MLAAITEQACWIGILAVAAGVGAAWQYAENKVRKRHQRVRVTTRRQ